MKNLLPMSANVTEAIETPSRVRRVLVALEPSAHGRAALTDAIAFAASLQAELVGLFVEDQDLLRVAGFSFAREFGFFEPAGRTLDVAAMERRLRGEAAALRREMARKAGFHKVTWSFRVARGRVVSEVVTAGEDADMIFVGRTQEEKHGVRVGSTARAVITRSRRTVYCAHGGAPAGRAVVVVYDGCGEATLDTAARLSGPGRQSVTVALIAESSADCARLEQEARSRLSERGMDAHFIRVADASAVALARIVIDADASALVIGETACAMCGNCAEALVEALDRPVVIVR